MKKFTLSLLVAFFSVALVAQEHMTFKSVSMEKNINEFVSALKSKGMVISKYDATLGNQTTRLMTGQFAGIEDCSLIILATPSTKKYVKFLPALLIPNLGVVFYQNTNLSKNHWRASMKVTKLKHTHSSQILTI